MSEHALLELLQAVAETGYRFVPPTPETHRRVNARAGTELAHDLRGILGWSRVFASETAGDRIFELLHAAGALEEVGPNWKSRLRVASLGERHYLHSAYPTTGADAVFFGPDTYRYVRGALASLPLRSFGRAVDIGCGSGAGGLAIADRRRVEQLWLSDINPTALSLARINAAAGGRQATVIHSDLFAGLDGFFDLILANPPYLVDGAKRAYRNGGGDLGMDLGLRIVREGINHLTDRGILFLYTGAPVVDGIDQFRAAVTRMLADTSFVIDYSEIDPDVFGEELENPAYEQVERIAAIALTITCLRS
jgi:methylase of polypeptide subunit release factors